MSKKKKKKHEKDISKTKYEVILSEYKLILEMYRDIYQKANVILVYITALAGFGFNTFIGLWNSNIKCTEAQIKLVEVLMILLWIIPVGVAIVCIFMVLRSRYIEMMEFNENMANHYEGECEDQIYILSGTEMINSIHKIKMELEDKTAYYDNAIKCTAYSTLFLGVELMIMGVIG